MPTINDLQQQFELRDGILFRVGAARPITAEFAPVRSNGLAYNLRAAYVAEKFKPKTRKKRTTKNKEQ